LNDEGKGHYKVLTGNPATQDFQVWHLYKNGNKIRCLDLKTGLQPQEAQWVYDNNIPDTWSEADWNPEGDIPEKANQIEVGQGDVEESQEEDNVTDSQTEENNVTDSQEETIDTNEEDNVTEEPQEEESDIHDFVVDYYNDEEDNVDDWWDDSENGDEWNLDTDIVQMDEEDNVAEEPKKKKTKKKVASAFIKSPDEEDNVIESKPRKKSKYNGKNVTGYQDGMLGTMTTASWIKQNLAHFHKAMAKKNIKGEPEKQFDSVMDKLKDIINANAKIALEMTSQSDDTLKLNFGAVPGLNSKYVITLDFTDKGVQISGSGVPEVGNTSKEISANKLKFTLDLMDKTIETISGTKPVNRKP
jgi:hypothetical protein